MTDFLEVLRKLFNVNLVLGVIEFPFSLLQLLLQVVLPLLLLFFLFKLLRLALKKVLSKSSMREEVAGKVLRWVRFIFRLVYLFLAVLVIGRLFGAELARYVKMFFSALNEPLIQSGNTKITLVTIILLIPVFMAASWIGKLTKSLVNQSIFDRLGLDDAKKFTLSTLLRYAAMTLVVILGLSIIGINLSSLAVLFGVLGIGVGFGLQSLVANFFAGVIIMMTRPIKEGDRILVNDHEGTVVQVRLLSTIVNTLLEETLIVPNSKLVENTIFNNTYGDRRIIGKNSVQVSYSSDLDQVIDVLRDVALRNPFGLKNPAPLVRVSSFDDSGITMNLFFWIGDVEDKYQAQSWNNLEIWRAFRAHHIEIPFPQVDLHVKTEGKNPAVSSTPPEVEGLLSEEEDDRGTPV